MGEFTQMIPRQRPYRDVLKVTEVSRRDVQEGEFCPSVGVVWVLDDKVEDDKKRG